LSCYQKCTWICPNCIYVFFLCPGHFTLDLIKHSDFDIVNDDLVQSTKAVDLFEYLLIFLTLTICSIQVLFYWFVLSVHTFVHCVMSL
jgi:hypothetical protein